MVDVKLSLLLLQVWRVNIGNRTVAIPFEESNFRIFLHQLLNNSIYIVLHFRVTQIQNQLIAVVINLSVFVVDSPIRVFLKEFALRVHHFRLNPDTEFHTGFLCSLHQCRHTARQLVVSHFPVTQTGLVILTRILVGKPSVVEQEHVHTQMLGFFHQVGQNFLVKVKTGVLPVVEQGQSAALTILQTVVAGPLVQVAATF